MASLYRLVGDTLGQQGRVEALALDFLRGNMAEMFV